MPGYVFVATFSMLVTAVALTLFGGGPHQLPGVLLAFCIVWTWAVIVVTAGWCALKGVRGAWHAMRRLTRKGAHTSLKRHAGVSEAQASASKPGGFLP